VAQFERGEFSTSDTPRPARPQTVTTLEIIHQNHEQILEDRGISAKSITEKPEISREGFGFIIHEDLESSPRSGPKIPERESKLSTVPVV